jgi:uncharacterized damage-inducible protein DinB
MANAGLSFIELLDWIGSETRQWAAWSARQPAAVWAVPIGAGKIATVRDLFFHVYVVDLRYGQRLNGLPVSAIEQEAVADPRDLFTLAARGQDLLRTWVVGAGPADLDRVIEFQTLSAGTLRASQRKVVAHSLTHHLRHLAQIATAMRQHGHPTDWGHDLMLSTALD